VAVHVGDALELELRGFDPAPTKMVSNLPYGIAATIVLKTIEELPSVTEWLVMVQREVGERLAAAPGSPAYGAPSVLAQLACDVRILRPVSRTVFRPVPNVESVLLGLTRRSRTEDPGATAGSSVQALVHGAFAHRRKTLAGSLALVPGAPEGIRERARAALVRLGHPANQRAEQLAPDEFRRLEELLWS
jgi:16S rRNA (adenine1518-N6/adenine1519-N6)-dimethyltransferase